MDKIYPLFLKLCYGKFHMFYEKNWDIEGNPLGRGKNYLAVDNVVPMFLYS